MGDWAMTIFLGFLLVAIVAGLVTLAIISYKHDKANKIDKETAEKLIEESLEAEFENVQVRATVVDLSCSAEVIGIKKPKAVEQYRVAFETEDGKTFKFDIPQEMYEGFEKGQTGHLTIVDNELYGFEIE